MKNNSNRKMDATKLDTVLGPVQYRAQWHASNQRGYRKIDIKPKQRTSRGAESLLNVGKYGSIFGIVSEYDMMT